MGSGDEATYADAEREAHTELNIARMEDEIATLTARETRLREALEGMLEWYAALPEPGLVPIGSDGRTLGAHLRDARAALEARS